MKAMIQVDNKKKKNKPNVNLFGGMAPLSMIGPTWVETCVGCTAPIKCSPQIL